MNTALTKFMELVAGCGTWQGICGVEPGMTEEEKSAAGAARIRRWGWQGHPGHPFMAVETDRWNRSFAATTSMPASGTIVFRFELARAMGEDGKALKEIHEAYEEAQELVEGLVEEMGERQGTVELMSLSRMEIEEDVVTGEEEEVQAWAFLGRAYWPAES